MIAFNPYQKNSYIIRKYLSKPITFIIALLSAFPFFFITGQFVLNLMETLSFGYISLTYSGTQLLACILSAFPPVSFLLLYFNSKKVRQNDEINVTKPRVLINLFSGANVLIYASAIYMSLYIMFTYSDTIYADAVLYYACAIIPLSILMILFHISLMLVYGAFSKSTKTIYLSYNGAGLLGVVSLIMLFVCLICGAVFAYLIFFDNGGLRLPDEMNYYLSFYLLGSRVVTAAIICVYALLFLFISIFAFGFKKHIKKIVTVYITYPSSNTNENADKSADNKSRKKSKKKSDKKQSEHKKEIPADINNDDFVPQNPFDEQSGEVDSLVADIDAMTDLIIAETESIEEKSDNFIEDETISEIEEAEEIIDTEITFEPEKVIEEIEEESIEETIENKIEDENAESSESLKKYTQTTTTKKFNKNTFFGIPVSVDSSSYKKISDKEFLKQSVRDNDEPLFCHKCGNQLIENSIFCNKCGTKVVF